ncbi:MAG: nucleotidyltransferase substrate binding protein [Spirochaetes bacterium]|nr:nucleotidyltransferase substrate binding protein [Spirochaetota bacterium]MBN2771112.1 nucleotidyltransferase substrate binding protein [Spirochaetota bacterium]
MNEDTRWLQRFANYKKALQHLNMAVNLSGSRDLSDLEKQGVIQAFEFTYELAWNVVKDFYESKGEINIQGSIDAFRLAFNRGLVSKGEALLNAVKSRRLTSHTYNEKVAEEIFDLIKNSYIHAFNELESKLLIEEEKDN